MKLQKIVSLVMAIHEFTTHSPKTTEHGAQDQNPPTSKVSVQMSDVAAVAGVDTGNTPNTGATIIMKSGQNINVLESYKNVKNKFNAG